jgi:hypothetical protein
LNCGFFVAKLLQNSSRRFAEKQIVIGVIAVASGTVLFHRQGEQAAGN